MTIRRLGFARWTSHQPSGGNRYDDELAAGLAALGLDVRTYAVTGPWPVPSSLERERFGELLANEEHWLVNNIVGSAAPEAIEAAVAAGRRVTLLVHYFPADDPALAPEDRARLAPTEARAVAAASTVVVTSAWAGSEVASRYRRGDAVVAVPGVEPSPFAPGSLLHGGPPMLLWLGRLTRTKDPVTLVEALSRLRDRDWTARLVGPDSVDATLARELRDRLAATGLADRIEVTGPRDGPALEAIWSATDLLVHTSRSETYGMVVSEALARGIPSVVAAGTGAVEAQQGVGATFPAGDVDALAVVVRGWLVDGRLRQHWRAAARQSEVATWPATAQRVASALTR